MSEAEANAGNPRLPYMYELKRPEDLEDLPEHVQRLIATVLEVESTDLKEFEKEFQECEPEYTCSEECQVQPCKTPKHKLEKLLVNDMNWDPLFSRKRLSKEDKKRLQRLHKRVNATQMKAYNLRGEKEAQWDAFYLTEFFQILKQETTRCVLLTFVFPLEGIKLIIHGAQQNK
jgi:hypothetical protein